MNSLEVYNNLCVEKTIWLVSVLQIRYIHIVALFWTGYAKSKIWLMVWGCQVSVIMENSYST